MKKQLRKLLSALLVLTMLLSALPMGVFAEEEHTPVAADELTEEVTKELNADPTAEPTEEPAAEPTIAPAPGASEAPATEAPEAPTAEPTVAPIVDSSDDALETATAGEPETEPEKEPETTPAAEDEADEGKPEETPAPAENNDDDPLSGLTDEQRKTLNALPEGFSADVVAFAMLRSTGCAHTLLKVGQDSDSESYTSIDSKKHLFTQKNLSRKLFCSTCGEVLQTIELGDIEEEWSHSWYSDGNTGGSLFDFTCLDCDEKITINPPCSHGSYTLNKNRTPYCAECGAIAYPGESMTMDDMCKHTHYTVHYPDTKLTEYSRWNEASHLKTTKVAQYNDDSESSQYYHAVCNDCGIDLVYLPSGKVEQLEGYDGELWGDMEYVQTASAFEVHTFENGVCKYCGEEQSEETCQHTNVKQVENTAKKTVDVTPVDDAEHQITTTRYFELRCADCDAYIGEAPADVSTQNEAHVWDNKNICTKCDYGNDCTHNNSTFHHYAKGDTHTGYQWTGNGETHYVIKYEVLVECDCCLGCMRFYLSSGTDGESRKLVSAESVTREKERYTETCHITNGWTEKRYFCMYCGYEKVMCDHSSGNTVDRLDRTVEPLYSDITETTHREQYTYNRYCDDCDTYLETVLGEVLAPVAHNFGNGNTCDCGYTKTEEPCQHTETKRVENTGKRTSELKPFSETEHEVTTTKYYELVCMACEAYISDDGTDTTTEKQPHDFSSGNTCACGYTKTEEPCPHTETKRVENAGKRTTKLTSLNDAEHEATTTKYYELHCAACDAYISDDGTDSTTEKQSHDFGSGTTCACGYTKVQETCQHVDVEVRYYPERTYTKLDAEKHICTAVYKTKTLYCNDCEQTIQTISANKTIVEEERHDWLWAGDGASGGNNKVGAIYDFYCYNCGETITLEPPCSHESLVNSDSEGLHCSVCGKDFGPDVIDGPVNECKHTNYTIIYPGVEETRYDQWNADSHLKKTMVSYYVDDDTTWGYDATCNDCGADLIYENGKIDDTIYSGRSGVDYKSIKSVFEAHSFVDGVCEHCGEKQTDEICPHTETKRVENTGKRTTKLTSLNETEHEVTTTKYYELHCVACDAYISDDSTDTTTEKQTHDFSSGTTCACGYVKAVEPSGKSVIKNVSISADARACVEKVGGETFAVTVTCNLDTVCVEMYFGKEHNQNTYRESSDYVETNGNRIFKMTYTLGGDGKSYAGEYPISVRPFSYVDRADWKNNQMGEEAKITLKVTHDNVSTVNEGGYSYSWSANGHTRMQTITTTLECKVCGNVSKSSTKKAKGSEEPHDLKENGKCSVCGYSEKLVHPGKDGNWKTKAPIVVYPNAYDEMLTWDRTGKIRYVEQKWNSGNNGSYRAKYWTNVDQSEGKCTRAAASMALSYMGIDLLPKDMGDHCKTGYKEDARAKDSSCNTRGRSTNSAGEEYEMTYDKFLELYNDYASDEEGKYSPVVIHTVRLVNIATEDGKEEWVRRTHAFIVVGHDQSDPDYFYVVDPGHGNNGGTGRIKLTQEGQMRVADYQCYKDGKWTSLHEKTRYSDDCNLIGVWQYYKEG
ncbi:MAG: C39 family peptidase [Clostridia bacterium]|nr:C39 family peptidase [Clostridia bacterium]